MIKLGITTLGTTMGTRSTPTSSVEGFVEKSVEGSVEELVWGSLETVGSKLVIIVVTIVIMGKSYIITKMVFM